MPNLQDSSRVSSHIDRYIEKRAVDDLTILPPTPNQHIQLDTLQDELSIEQQITDILYNAINTARQSSNHDQPFSLSSWVSKLSKRFGVSPTFIISIIADIKVE